MVAPGAAHGVTIVEDDATLGRSFRSDVEYPKSSFNIAIKNSYLK